MGFGIGPKSVGIVLAVLAAGGCAGAPISVGPSPEPHYQVGMTYQYRLPSSHCGVKDIVLNDRVWLADPPLFNGAQTGPPDGWELTDEIGSLTLLSKDHASFRAKSGRVIEFYLAPGVRPTPNRCI